MLWNMILDVLLRIASLNTSWLFVNPEILKLLKIIFKFLVSCTILVCVVSLIGKVLFLLFRSVFACSICKFVRGFSCDSRWDYKGCVDFSH